jgi:hypothetical protein
VTLQLTARVVAFVAEDDNDVLFAGVAEHPDGSGWSLLFQGGSPDPDESTEDEDYCLVTETAACVYGGVTLRGDRLLLSLDSEAATLPGERGTVPAEVLVRQLGVDSGSLVGSRYTCLEVTDRFGTTFSDFELC